MEDMKLKLRNRLMLGIALVVLGGLAVGSGALAQTNCGTPGGVFVPCGPEIGLSDTPVKFFLTDILLFLASVIGALSILMIVIGGIMYIVSAGDTAKVTLAKDILKGAVIGLIVALMAYVIVFTVSCALGAGNLYCQLLG